MLKNEYSPVVGPAGVAGGPGHLNAGSVSVCVRLCPFVSVSRLLSARLTPTQQSQPLVVLLNDRVHDNKIINRPQAAALRCLFLPK